MTKKEAIEKIKLCSYNLGKEIVINFQNDEEFILKAIASYPGYLKFASLNFRSNKSIVLKAVKQHGCALEYASNEMKNDNEVVLEAIKSYSFAFKYMGLEIRKNKEFVLKALEIYPYILEYISEELKYDQDVIDNQRIELCNKSNNLKTRIILKEHRKHLYYALACCRKLKKDITLLHKIYENLNRWNDKNTYTIKWKNVVGNGDIKKIMRFALSKERFGKYSGGKQIPFSGILTEEERILSLDKAYDIFHKNRNS